MRGRPVRLINGNWGWPFAIDDDPLVFRRAGEKEMFDRDVKQIPAAEDFDESPFEQLGSAAGDGDEAEEEGAD